MVSFMLIFAVVFCITIIPLLPVAFVVSKLQPDTLRFTVFTSPLFPVRTIAELLVAPAPATDIVAFTPLRVRSVVPVAITLIKAYLYSLPAVALISTSLRLTAPASSI